ncbi:MAG: SDR family NAD(P)-dependent oxidoreductase [Anaerolineales bacterium]|nr:SDR family NAD(P)-dependent oxidoreductase [Anaerolineales bacterium]MCK5429397.1 SDR family NAD(P)-dependent oxidoreductase [Anaerolineales bacterium]
MKDNNFQDKIVIITGASSGIGRVTAIEMAKRGAHVALAARRQNLLEEVAAEIRAVGQEALVLPTDVTDISQIERLVSEVVNHWGRVDILVSNAGQYIRAPIEKLTIETVQHSMAVNYFAGVNAIIAVLPHMRAQKSGHIVVVTSMDGKIGVPPDAPYVSAKFALTGFASVLRQELRGTGIYVSNIIPGRVETPMIDELRVPWISAKISSESVARAIMRAIRKRQAEVIIPYRGVLLYYLYALSPRVSDWVSRRFKLDGWGMGS